MLLFTLTTYPWHCRQPDEATLKLFGLKGVDLLPGPNEGACLDKNLCFPARQFPVANSHQADQLAFGDFCSPIISCSPSSIGTSLRGTEFEKHFEWNHEMIAQAESTLIDIWPAQNLSSDEGFQDEVLGRATSRSISSWPSSFPYPQFPFQRRPISNDVNPIAVLQSPKHLPDVESL